MQWGYWRCPVTNGYLFCCLVIFCHLKPFLISNFHHPRYGVHYSVHFCEISEYMFRQWFIRFNLFQLLKPILTPYHNWMRTLTLASVLLDWRGPVGRSGRLLFGPGVAGAVPHFNAVRCGSYVRSAPAEPAHHPASRRWRCCHRMGALGPWLCRWVPGNGLLDIISFPSLLKLCKSCM